MSRLFVVFLLTLPAVLNAQVNPWDEAFKKQWYAGLAEMTRYELTQSRYGETRTGDAVFIFVTEDFLTGPQVKHERGDGPSTSVLKLNAIRNFTTGIYPYSVMTSVFTPVDPNANRALKVTTSIQEWCGHTFTQINHRNARYTGIVRSYFQSEADRDIDLPDALLEDELWTRVRLSPERLPLGDIRLIPGTVFQRLSHTLPDIHTAKAERSTQDSTHTYRVTYTSLPRTLEITFEQAYPHAIVAWRETYEQRGRRHTTSARKTHALMLDYWSKNAAADSTYRVQLGLE